jgi:hypothetical protein
MKFNVLVVYVVLSATPVVIEYSIHFYIRKYWDCLGICRVASERDHLDTVFVDLFDHKIGL